MVSLAEKTNALRKEFQSMDVNNDENLSKEELFYRLDQKVTTFAIKNTMEYFSYGITVEQRQKGNCNRELFSY